MKTIRVYSVSTLMIQQVVIFRVLPCNLKKSADIDSKIKKYIERKVNLSEIHSISPLK